jgi:predicted ATP-grasp superfamily ATP-dependent carboligase
MESRASILLLDGSTLSTLAFTRSLGRAGIRVTVADSSPHAAAARSRYCSSFIACPSPATQTAAFREWLLREVARREYGLLMGTTDVTVPLLSDWRDTLGLFTQVPLPGREALRQAYDKGATLELARRLGIHVPATVFAKRLADLDEVARRSRWPVVIKPRSSVESRDGSRVSFVVEYAFDAESLIRNARTLDLESSVPMIQEYIPGTGIGCFFLFHQHKILAKFQHRRIRDTNPTGSGSSLRESVPLSATLMDESERLLRAMNWDGLAMVEYRVNSDGTGYLMEVNPRPWGSMQLPIEAGVDFPLMWYRAMTGGPVEPISSYRVGIRCRSLAGDLRHLESVLLGPPPGWRLAYPKKVPTLLAFCHFWGRNLRYDEFAANDWLPGFVLLGNYFRGIWDRVRNKLQPLKKEKRSSA